jgi:putative membrane-bound dehydrogenase-like protein
MKKLLVLGLGFLFISGSGAQNGHPGWGEATWIWDEQDADKTPQTNEPRYVRRSFTLSAKPVQAELWITADNHYTVYLNGQKIGADGEWNTVEKYQVAKYLVQGKNVLAILAKNDGGPAGLIARLHVRTPDKKSVLIGTGSQCRITQTKHVDWLKTDFDDSAWPTAVVLGEPGMAPWNIAGPVASGGKSNQPNVSAVDPKITKPQSATDQLKHFNFPEGFEIELVAEEPLVINPITMTLDEKGRIIVSESHTYRYGPSGSPIKPFANPVIRLDPLPEGKGFKRTLIADGFDDPVMGIAVKGQKLWLTANNFLYQYDLPETGKAINKKTLLVDKNKAWNPFGMFVLEWGPDGLLYMSVGDHRIDIHGPTNKISGRGNSGIVLRMKPDGSDMQRLVHGLRVPYSFEYDPFGQLWLLSNGEGNPDRFVRVIDGVDYHCYSRSGVDNAWLAGNHPLAPPCFENMRGAHTQLLRYYGAAWPEKYQGNLFCDNWGAHGFAGPNRAIFRFVADARGNIVTREPFLSCTDPHFRPSHIILDPDGNMLVADWYGRDDESDKTGRIWRLKYTGKDRMKVVHKLESSEWKELAYAISALGSPHHLIREKAVDQLVRAGDDAIQPLGRYVGSAASAKEPLGAANALWALLRIDTSYSKAAIGCAEKHPDWKVRRLALNILRRYQVRGTDDLAKRMSKDDDPAVRLEAALARTSDADKRTDLLNVLSTGAAKDAHLRYEAAWHLAKVADEPALGTLLKSEDEAIRLAGMIAIDVACCENFPSKNIALTALAKALEAPGMPDAGLLLTLVQLNGDKSVLPALEKLIARDDVPAALTAKALLVLKNKAGGFSKSLSAAAGKRLIEAVQKGTIRINAPAEQLVFLEFLESEGPTDFALKQIAQQIQGGHPSIRPAAHALARKFGAKSSPLAGQLWPRLLNPKTAKDDAAELLATIAMIESSPDKASWQQLLSGNDPLLRTEAVRWFRQFKGKADMIELLSQQSNELVKKDGGLKEDLDVVFRHIEAKPDPTIDKAALTKHTLEALAGFSPANRKTHAIMGRQVFERSACTKCHTTVTQNTPLAPSLKGIALQKPEYLIESVLYPSKIIKTGFESETIVTKNGKSISGLVKDEGKFLRVLNLDQDIKIAKEQIDSRRVQKVSIMPEGQEAQLSRREFVDLMAYLMTLK